MTLRLLGHELEEARRVFESREPGRGLVAARSARRTTRGRNRTGDTDEPADRERTNPCPTPGAVHATILVVTTRVTTFGDLLLDVIVRAESPLVPGDDLPVRTAMGAGGQAANVAAWAAELGASARFVGRIGDDVAGALVSGALRDRGVEVCGPCGGRTGVVVSIAAGGDRTMASDRGTAVELAPRDLDTAWFDCDVLHISGYALLEEPMASAAEAAAAHARTRGAPVSLDVSTWTLVDDAFRSRLESIAPDLVFATEAEQQAVGEAAATRWVLKRGARGLLADGVEHDALATAVVDTTGAGDALAAGFLVGGAELALATAARCCSTMGAMP